MTLMKGARASLWKILRGVSLKGGIHFRDVINNDEDASKPVSKHFDLPGNSSENMVVYGLSLHQGNTESRKSSEQKFIFQDQ